MGLSSPCSQPSPPSLPSLFVRTQCTCTSTWWMTKPREAIQLLPLVCLYQKLPKGSSCVCRVCYRELFLDCTCFNMESNLWSELCQKYSSVFHITDRTLQYVKCIPTCSCKLLRTLLFTMYFCKYQGLCCTERRLFQSVIQFLSSLYGLFCRYCSFSLKNRARHV